MGNLPHTLTESHRLNMHLLVSACTRTCGYPQGRVAAGQVHGGFGAEADGVVE